MSEASISSHILLFHIYWVSHLAAVYANHQHHSDDYRPSNIKTTWNKKRPNIPLAVNRVKVMYSVSYPSFFDFFVFFSCLLFSSFTPESSYEWWLMYEFNPVQSRKHGDITYIIVACWWVWLFWFTLCLIYITLTTFHALAKGLDRHVRVCSNVIVVISLECHVFCRFLMLSMTFLPFGLFNCFFRHFLFIYRRLVRDCCLQEITRALPARIFQTCVSDSQASNSDFQILKLSFDQNRRQQPRATEMFSLMTLSDRENIPKIFVATSRGKRKWICFRLRHF